MVSILLPVKNAATTLERAIRSIQNQSLGDWELLIADDGSSDGSTGIARSRAAADPRIRLLQLPPLGIVNALNTVAQEARGRFIARMDADDISLPDRLLRQVKLLNEYPDVDVASCLVAHGGDLASQRGYALHVQWINSLRSPEQIALNRFVDSPVAHPSVMFRRELLERFGAYSDGDFPEDYELWLRWMGKGVSFAKVEETLLVWNDPPQRLSRTSGRYSQKSFYRIKCHFLAHWLEQNVSRHRPLLLWGAGRATRARFRSLEESHRPFAAFIDVDPQKLGSVVGRPVISPDSIPQHAFVISGVASRGASARIVNFLRDRNFIDGKDFICAA